MVAEYESILAKHNMSASGLALGAPEMKEYLSRGKCFLISGADFYGILTQSAKYADMSKRCPAKDLSKVYKQI